MWRASVLTIFPEIFPGPLGASLAGKALASGTWSLDVTDIRSFATDKHRSVDDTPAGGGPGMVMKADVLGRAIDAAATDQRPRLLLSPRGSPLTQSRVEELAAGTGVVLVCGRFEGIDERVIAGRGLEEVSVGDYVLSGGEIAAMALIDACVRLLPGVMGAAASGYRRELCGRPTGIPPIYPPAGVGGATDPGGSSFRRSRQNRRVAAIRGRKADEGAPAGPVGTLFRAKERAREVAITMRDRRVTNPVR